MYSTIEKYTVAGLNALIRVTVFDVEYLGKGNTLPAVVTESSKVPLALGGPELSSEYRGGKMIVM
jgi:hypothetical protein